MFPRIFFIFFLVLSPSFGNESEGPSETECRPYIEKALQREGVTQEPTLPPDDVGEPPNLSEAVDGSKEDAVSKEEATSSNEDALESAEDASVEAGVPLQEASVDDNSAEELFQESSEAKSEETLEGSGEASAPESTEEIEGDVENSNEEVAAAETIESLEPASNEVSAEEAAPSSEETAETTSAEALESQETTVSEETGTEVISETETSEDKPASDDSVEQIVEENTENSEQDVKPEQPQPQSEEDGSGETQTVEILSSEEVVASESTNTGAAPAEAVGDEASEPSSEEPISQESASEEQAQVISDSPVAEESIETAPDDSGSNDSVEQPDEKPSLSADASSEPQVEPAENEASPVAEAVVEAEEAVIPEEEVVEKNSEESLPEGSSPVSDEQPTSSEGEDAPVLPEEDLIMPIEIPSNLRTREHMTQILKLGQDADDKEKLLAKTMDNTLRELKKLYDVAIKPLEILYKYRDLSNRHFGDPEIFSKPLVLFMGPWSGGKSTIINYLLENEFKKTALRSGAEPSPAYFNIVMHGENEEILDGTQLAADWTFSGLQKFGQGLLDRLRGLRLNHPLLQKVNIVEIPGILEIRKQVERLFPFNDACQWFIDRADIIFLVYDPSKLDVGPETEAILDQLKGREMQTRIVLNKADQVKPEELMRVQSTLIWNISPLMSSTEPPVMYSTSLWSLPYEVGAPSRLLYAQECSFLQDLREAIDKRVENKIASARRFAVRVRNHAKMVDCYLTTYYNHKSFFGNKKKVSDDIIEHPQDYHIYEGLSTLTNISRYDLPDPDVYKDFFRLNPVYEFQQLAATCTYFRGCPINRLDVAIAYDLPDLIGKYKKSAEQLLSSRK